VDPAGRVISQVVRTIACSVDNNPPTQLFPVVAVTDDQDDWPDLVVRVQWSGFHQGGAVMVWDGFFYGTIGPVPYPGTPNEGGTIDIRVTATDSGGATSTLAARGPATVLPCSGVPG
jgi:putative peptide zinc metalloprotease protein